MLLASGPNGGRECGGSNFHYISKRGDRGASSQLNAGQFIRVAVSNDI